MLSRVSCCAAALFASAFFVRDEASADGPVPNGLYTPPADGFILDPTEAPIELSFESAPLSKIQAQLDAARTSDPDSPIILTLTGAFVVVDSPLALPSKTSLILYGTIEAAPDATAPSLVSIIGQRKVAVAGGVLDGHYHSLVGLDAEGSAQVNVDAVTIKNTGLDGLRLSGNGGTVWNSGSAIMRCNIAKAGASGIVLSSITQALLLDNFVHHNAGAGIRMSATHSSIVNNVVQENGVGIVVDTGDNLISDNEIRDNRDGGVWLLPSSANTDVLRNVIAHNSSSGVDLDGSNNLLYLNTFDNPVDLIERGSSNWVVPGRPRPLEALLSNYFYPPTIDNRHADPVMNGRNRTDVEVTSCESPAISQVQKAYDDAREQHPDDVIVLALRGEFTADVPLTLQSYTAVILDGAVFVPSPSNLAHVMTAVNPSELISVSGGLIDLGGRPMEGIYFPSTSLAHIDQVTVVRGGQRDVRTGGGMIHLQRGGSYNIIHANRVDQSGGRCIWTQHNNSRYVVVENYLTNCNMDAVDFDSATSNSLAVGNFSEDNRRYGVFVEQSDSFNKIYGNFTTTRGIPGNPGHGVGVYNNATAPGRRAVTDKNTVFCNTSDTIANGLRVGSVAVAGGIAETARTYLFNNVVRNAGDAILFDTQFPESVENYFSQTVLEGNLRDINSHPSGDASLPDFFNPRSAVAACSASSVAWSRDDRAH